MIVKTGWFLATLSLVLLVMGAMLRTGGTVHAAAPTAAQQVVDKAVERFVAGDRTGWLSYFSEDAVLTDTDIDSGKSFAAVGRGALGSVFDGIIETHLKVEPTGVSAHGDKVIATGRWSDDVSTAAGVSRYLATSTVTVRDAKIVRFDLTYNTADAATRTYLAYSAAQELVPPPGTLIFPLGPGRDGRQTGDAYLSPVGTLTAVFIAIAPGATGELQPAELQSGDCPANRALAFPLASVLDGFSFTLLSAPIDDLADLSLHVQKRSGLSILDVTCGDASSAVLLEQPAPAPEPVAPAPRPAAIVAPNTGTGTNVRHGSLAWAAAALVLLGALCAASGVRYRSRQN